MGDGPDSKVGVVDLIAVAAATAAIRPAWSHESADFNLNLIVLETGDGIGEHRNSEVDVLLVGVTGSGTVTIDGRPHAVSPGTALLVPKGAQRGVQAITDRFAYLTCHRRRAGLWPTTGP